MSRFTFKVSATDGTARRGVLSTPRGDIDTPAFMPVGTAGTVKAMMPSAVRATGAQIILGNTYHLMLRPGAERVAALGGLHKFMNWHGPILTDSGGFQVMSLAKLRTLDKNGVTFQSHLDGNEYTLTPERSIEIQLQLGADICMVLDECTPFSATAREVADSMRLSLTWAQRCRDAFSASDDHALFGIVQGGMDAELRAESAEALIATGFDGYAVGGLAVGEGRETMLNVLDFTLPRLPGGQPRYLMGVGKPDDLVEAVARGVDMFDCVLPTRSGRTGQAFTRHGTVNLRNARHRDDARPLEADCPCPACADYSRAYLNHLIRAEEMLGAMLLTWHNLTYYQRLMAGLRRAISGDGGEGGFSGFRAAFAADRARGDIEPV